MLRDVASWLHPPMRNRPCGWLGEEVATYMPRVAVAAVASRVPGCATDVEGLAGLRALP